jgi:hypothetical protein
MRVALGLWAALLVGCGGTLPVAQTYAPSEVGVLLGTKLAPSAVVRASGAREPIPSAVTISPTDVTWTPGGEIVHKLQSGDVLEADDDGTIVGVRTASGTEIKFARGSATSPPGADFVRGRPAGERQRIALAAGDRIEARGELGDGDAVPGVGRVTDDRPWAVLVAGSIAFVSGYGPAVYVGAASPQSHDRPLLAPVAGPWIALAVRPACNTPQGDLPIDPCTGETAAKIGIVLMGIAQTAGAIAIVFALPSRLALEDARGRRIGLVPTGQGGALVGAW